MTALCIQHSPVISSGITNERAVIESYNVLIIHVIHNVIIIRNFAGVWLHESGAIGAFPDGIASH